MRRLDRLWYAILAAVIVAAACDSETAESDDDTTTSPGGAGGSAGGGKGGDGGGGGAFTELDLKCTPTFTLQLEDAGPKGQIFTDAVPEPEPFVQAIGRTVCNILYRQVDEVRDANHITLIIRDDPDYAGWKMGDVGNITVMISTGHLADVQSKGQDVAEEITGILLHEMTHMYQHDDKAPGEGSYPNMGNVLEGVADFVRIRAGHTPNGAVTDKLGTWDDAGYWKPAFFLLWIDGIYPDFLYQLNLTMVGGDGIVWSPDTIETITGQSVDQLWLDYASASCCEGTTHTCCM